jgi:acetoin utilization deacetylase AcuC-like enzyme
MRIIHNDREYLHYAHSRPIRAHGERHLLTYEPPLLAQPPTMEPGDDKDTPARVAAILAALRAAQMTDIALPIDHGLTPIHAVHTPEFTTFLSTIYAEFIAVYGTRAPILPTTYPNRKHPVRPPLDPLGRLGYFALDTDTPIVAGTWEAAYWCAQTALTAADRALAGDAAVYALCRPSGHHANVDQYGGFCFLNNAAIAARWLQAHGAGRVAILDVDYHHGNGTQEIFYRDPSVLFCSLHGDPAVEYPYFWGFPEETGADAGAGFNRNWALPKGSTDDSAYLAALDEALAVIRGYAPAYLVVSAGFDIGAHDFYGGFTMTTAGIGAVGARIGALCRSLGVPVVVCQEGGYLVEKLGAYVVAFLKGIEST